MKNLPSIFTAKLTAVLAISVAWWGLPSSAQAASATWTSNSSGTWTSNSNWSTGAYPGSATYTAPGSSDTASFTAASEGNPVITITGTTNIGGIDFSSTLTPTSTATYANSYTFSSGPLALTSGSLINTESNYIGSAGFATTIALAGTATFSANEAFGGSLTFGSLTSLPTYSAALTLNGTNSSYFNDIGGSVSGTFSITKTGTGLWVLGTNQSTSSLTLSNLTLNQGTLVVAGVSSPSIGSVSVTGNSTLRYQNTGLGDISSKITLGDTATLTVDTAGNAVTWASALTTGPNGTGGLTKTGLGTLSVSLSATQTYTGSTTVLAGILNLTDTVTSTSLTNPFSSSSGLVLGGGELEVTGTTSSTVSQTFNGTTLKAGISEITPYNGTGTIVVNLGTITRNSGGLVNLLSTTRSTYLTPATGNDANGILTGVTYNGNFATSTTGTITAATAVQTTQNAAGSWTSSTANYVTSGAVTGGATAAGSQTIGSLYLNNASSQSFTITNSLAVTDGLGFGSSIGNNASTISGGTLTSAGGDLIIFNDNASNTFGNNTISSVIADSGVGAHTNVILDDLQGTMYLTGANVYTGNTYVGGGGGTISTTSSGTVVVGGASGAQIGSTNATVYINGGNQSSSNNGIAGSNNVFRVGDGVDNYGNVLGTIELDNGVLSLDQAGVNTLSANVTGVVGAGSIEMDGTGATTVNLVGTNTFYGLKSTSSGTLILAGATSVNTFIDSTEFNAAGTNSSTIDFQSGSYTFLSPGNADNQIGTWVINGSNANVYLAGARYLPSAGTNTFTVTAGSLNFGGDRWTPGDQQGANSSITFNVSGTGTINVAEGSLILGNSPTQTGQNQSSTSSVTFNQSGGVANFGIAPGQGQGDSSSNVLTIGNAYTQVQAQYNLSGGTMRAAGIQGVAPAGVTVATATATLGSNTVTLPLGSTTNVAIGQVLTGNPDFAAGTYVTGILGSGTITVSSNATASGTNTTNTFTQLASSLYRVFDWTGGTLTIGSVNMTNLAGEDASNAARVGTLFQGGGTLAPGDTFDGVTFTGKTTITGNYQLDGGYDLFTIGGSPAATGFHSANSNYDDVAVSGTATLNGGGIEVGLLNGYASSLVPSSSFKVLTAGTVTGTYSNLNAAGRGITVDRSLTFGVTYGTGTVTVSNWDVPAVIALTGSSTFEHAGTLDALPYTLTNAASNSPYNQTLNQDNLYYTLSGSVTGTGTLAPSASINGSPATITAGTATYTVTATDPNAQVQGDSTNMLDSATATFTITGYTGQGVWNNPGGGSWGTVNGTGTQAFARNWVTSGGSPGLDPNYLQSDSATFGHTSFAGTATVTLDGASPSLNAVSFTDATSNYQIAQGSSGTLHLDSASTATVTVSAGNDSISAPVELDSNAATSVAGGSTLTISGNISQVGNPGLVISGTGTTVLSGSNIYGGGTTVNTGATLLVSNGTNGSATGTGTFALQMGAALGGAGQIQSSSFTLGGAGTAAKVAVGNGADTTSGLTLTGSSPNTITNTQLTFNLSVTVPGQANVLNVGSSSIAFSGTTLELNMVGIGVVSANTSYELIAGTSNSQYGLMTTTNYLGQNVITAGQGLSFNFEGGPSNSWYQANSYLIESNGDIDVVVVPEPGTWAMMLGGLAVLVFWQRTRRHNSK